MSQIDEINTKWPYFASRKITAKLNKGFKKGKLDFRVNRPNQVWGIDITYIRLVNGWIYLAAVIDWFTRFVLAWETSIGLEKEMVIKVANKAFEVNIPDIMNSAQGAQMTSDDYIQTVKNKGVKISMNGRGSL